MVVVQNKARKWGHSLALVQFARIIDSKALGGLDSLAHKELKWWKPQTSDQFSTAIRANPFLTVICKDENEPVGYLQATLRFAKEALWIEDVYVLKRYRRKGIGRRMVEALVAHWKGTKKAIVLITPDRNMRCFTKMGFKKKANYMVLTS